MKTCNVRFILFSLLVLVAVAGPGVPKLPVSPKVPVRGVGCSGAAGASRAVPLPKLTSVRPLKSAPMPRPIPTTGARIPNAASTHRVLLVVGGEPESVAGQVRDVVRPGSRGAGEAASEDPLRRLLFGPLLVPEPPVSSFRPSPRGLVREGLPHLKPEPVPPVAESPASSSTGEESGSFARVFAPASSSTGEESGILARVLAYAVEISKGNGTSGKVSALETRKEQQKVEQSGDVARLLKRPLTPPERILVQVMKQQGKQPEEMARILEELPPRRSPKKGP